MIDADSPDAIEAEGGYSSPISTARTVIMGEFTVQAFEDSSQENGVRYWYAHDFMGKLGYETWPSFKGVIIKAMASCAQLSLEPADSFIRDRVDVEGHEIETYRLTRFACFLVAMHADDRKPEVQKAKAVLAAVADSLIAERIGADDLSRIETRENLKEAEKAMSSAAYGAGLPGKNFAIFKDAGFRGMYNMSLKDLQARKGAPEGKTLYDFMGLEEMAGNLFRVTQTAASIRSQNVRGTQALTKTARDVGADVRGIMIRNSGTAPEHLQLAEDVSDAKKRLKNTHKQMKKLDSTKSKKKENPPSQAD